MQGPDNKNLFLAIVVSLAILIGWQYLVPQPKPVPHPVATTEQTPEQQAAAPTAAAAVAPIAEPKLTREDALAASPRVAIETPSIKGSINLKGGRIDDLTLQRYHVTVDPNSPAIVLLSPSGGPDTYFADEGWSSTDAAVKLPGDDTVWTASGDKLTLATPVTLSWDNGDGLKFTRTISIDDKYMFTVKQAVNNDRSDPVELAPYARISRASIPTTASTSWWGYSYEGPIGAFNDVKTVVKYKDVTTSQRENTTGGWLGFSDKYWLTAVAPADQALPIKAGFISSASGTKPTYQADYLGSASTVAPGTSVTSSILVFAGPKEVRTLAAYRDKLGLPLFDDAVDFGLFWFFTKPIFYILDYFYGVIGNFGVAILLLTVLMKAAFFPLQTRAVLNMNKMKALQPEIVKLREKFGDDKMRLNQETMALYKRVGANPVAGCLPIALQIPVFFSLYKVLYVSLEMWHAPFFGWVQDLSDHDPTTLFNLFGLLPFTPPPFLDLGSLIGHVTLPTIGVWPVIYCISMVLQQRMQPMQVDPVQARMFKFMPFLFTFMMAGFPAGLVIYWSWSNTLTMAQQWLITRRTKVIIPAAAE
jgi:YidC/Oxa1 family membrane protein insertase